MYISSLGMIDYVHRFFEIVQAMPLLRKDHPKVKKLGNFLKSLQDCRNYLQHMRGDLSKNDDINYPIIGSISWVDNDQNYTLFCQQTTKSFQVPGIAYDRKLNKYVCRFQLSIGGYEIQLDNVYNEVKSFWLWLDKSSSIEPKSIKDYEWGVPMIISSTVSEP